MLFQSHSSANLLALMISQKIKVFSKIHLSFEKNPNFWTFWDISQIQSRSPANLQLLAIWKKRMIFFWKAHLFFIKTPIFLTLNLLRIVAIPVVFSATLLALAIFQNVKKNFSKNLSIFWERTPSLELFENLTNSVAFSGKFATFSDF